VVSGKSEREKGQLLKHSDEYLEKKAEKEQERKRAAAEMNGDAGHNKRAKVGESHTSRDVDGRISSQSSRGVTLSDSQRKQVASLKARALNMLADGMTNATANEYLARYGKDALKFWDEDQRRAEIQFGIEMDRGVGQVQNGARTAADESRRLLSQDLWTGRMVGGEGRWEDDWDNRLPR
jgi:hypothetical protein